MIFLNIWYPNTIISYIYISIRFLSDKPVIETIRYKIDNNFEYIYIRSQG